MTTAPRRTRATRRAAAVIAIAASVVGLSLTGALPASAASSRVSYHDSVPSWAKSANDSGTPAADTSVEGEIYLPLRKATVAKALAIAISTPGTSSYRKTLSPSDFFSRFSPRQSDLDAVVTYLKNAGLTITAVPKSRLYVVFRGSADAVNAALATSLHNYRYAGHTLLGPSKAPSLPASVASKVSGISVDQSRLLTRPDLVKRGGSASATASSVQAKTAAPKATPVVDAPCSTYIGEHTVTVPEAYGSTSFPTFNCGYTPAQLRSAYGLKALSAAGVNGTGQTVAITDAYASPSIVRDVNTYSKALGEPTLRPGQYTQIVPKSSDFKDQAACGFPSGWQGEQTLDVEAVHGLAPGANILYVGGFNCGGGLDVATSTILDNKLATIVSNSWGNIGEAVPQDVLEGETNLHIQAAAEGIGLYFSSGDNGDEVADLGIVSPDYPASSPFVTSVGGTSLGIDKNGKISFETGWGDALDKIVKDSTGALSYSTPLPGALFGGGAGGGASAYFTEPTYQKGVVPSSLSGGFRVSPDISALADPYTGFSIGIRPIVDDTTLRTGAFENDTYGGTSLASPLVAAQMAIVQQATHHTIGFANPTLYGLDKVAPSLFRDVVPNTQALVYTSAYSGNSYLVSLGNDTSLTTTKGYDDVTGIGGLTFGALTAMATGRH
ncbi:S53 family peptidase [Galbitalea soli]|uniref:S8/S53 family peptidase n=1 Tax=Galbitalea soli TaxID=1268042 RepID=A0A7C9PPZ5_9MICO|nr:S53 family peptidase [Galbitalea soli]NEM92428.1 S8/S53 family peptidase [Galbitalea soli]NYJ29463.1 subtilase family serine protease [Galbitalea soli]